MRFSEWVFVAVAIAIAACLLSSCDVKGKVNNLTTSFKEKKEAMAKEAKNGVNNMKAQIAEAVTEKKVVITGSVSFKPNSSTIEPKEAEKLSAVIGYCEVTPEAIASVEGFADPTGSSASNISLSVVRALVVKKYLNDHGCQHTNEIGYGSTKHPERQVIVTVSNK